ncbi:MAG: UvrD-helicase domain-containing protein [Syntrophaceae bacterium]|nr:UvrD-helicase domain-containing protein [Syntrophaceae bacterium]
MMNSILLKASAGSGKTTSLTKEVFKRILIGGKFIAALTFTRAATTEMRSRIMEQIASKKELTLLDRLRLIMEAGRVGYSTIDSFFYRLLAASGFAPNLADEKAQIGLTSEIEVLFRDNVVQSGKADNIIAAARILRTDIDTLLDSLADEQTMERCLHDMERLADLDELMKENGLLRNRLTSLSEKAKSLADGVTSNVKNRVINYLAYYDNFISKTVATHSNLEDYKSLGKNIAWGEKPYSKLNTIFRDYRKTAEVLALNKALLRELAVAFLWEIYFEAANAVKREKGLIFFADVRRGLLALDGVESSERPRLMSNYFSLGLDRTEHLLIDEFQDTSKGDIQILLPLIDEILSGRGERGERSFFAVGDWKQMIYGWRGADRDALEEAIGGYIKNKVIKESSLAYNYRSTQLLISFFNELVGHIFTEKEKNETQKAPEDIKIFDGVTEVNLVELEKDGNSQDAFYPVIVEFLKKKKDEYGCFWGDMTVLALTNNHVQKIEAELIKNGIGVATVKGRQLLSTQEGVAVMLFIAGVLAKEGKSKFIAQALTSPFWEDIFVNVKAIREEFAQKYPQPFGLMAVSCAIEILRGKVSTTILNIWQEEAYEFFREGGADVDDFLLRMFNIRSSVKVPESENSENIKVDTIHGAKGLQFKHVFVFWNEDERESPFYLESQKCNVQFSVKEIEFLEASDSAIAKEIIDKHAMNLTRLRREKANVFYVAATRAIQMLTVFLPKKKDEKNYKPVHQAVLDTFSVFAPTGSKKEKCSSSGEVKDLEAIKTCDVPERHNDEPEKYSEIDPALVSDYIKSGIIRGDRLHRWLAGVIDKDAIPQAGELSDDEYDAAIRFVKRSDVSSVMFRPGKLYIEQQISDKESFGIVDRMIVSNNLITIIDYKSGSMRGLRHKYDEQLKRYTKIMETLYPQRKVEYYILSIDDN